MEAPVNILLVDDYPENLKALEAILERPEYRLVKVRSGPEALKALLKDEFALVLLDVMMPGMDGYEVATRIKDRERNQFTPIIFLTAAAKDIEHIFKGYSVGAVDYLLKPLAPEVVRAKVEVFVDLHLQSREIKRQGALIAKKEKKEKEYQLGELRKSEEKRFRNLADSIPQIIWTMSPDGDLTYCNRRWIEYTGLSLEDSKQSGFLKAIHPDDQERITKSWEESVRTGRVFEEEYRFKRKADGAYRWFLVRCIPTHDLEGRIVEWFGGGMDIEFQKQSEIELKANLQARDEFFSIASHELKTPTTSLKLGLQLLARNLSKEKKDLVPTRMVFEKITNSIRQTDRLGNLIENLLDISRIRSNRLLIDREKLDFAAVTEEATARLKMQAEEAGCTITLKIKDKSVLGEFDRVRVEQVLTNLLTNAIKYGKGSPILVGLEANEDTITLTVTDHGIGISTEDQKRIFGRFERAVTPKDFSGLGLGLYITQQIVHAHGGQIHLESELHQGSTFTIRLPRYAAPVKLPSHVEFEGGQQWANAIEKRSS